MSDSVLSKVSTKSARTSSFRTNKNAIRKTTEDKVFEGIILAVMLFTLIITAYPFYFVVIMSLNDGVDSARGGIYVLPREFTIDNYKRFLSDPSWKQAMIVSVAKTLIGAVLTVLFTCLIAYGLTPKDLLFKRFYNIVMLSFMYFSSGLIPYYLVLREIGLLNTFGVYVIPTMFSIYYCLLARSFFSTMPDSLFESAKLDGAGQIRIYLQIVLPLSKPLMATLFLFAAVNQWNSWSDTAFFAAGNRDLRSLAYLMRDVIMRNQIGSGPGGDMASVVAQQYRRTTAQSVQFAAMVIAVLPIMLVYPFLQKYFVQGIMIGAVKG